MLKRELELIKRYVHATTDATLAIRVTPVGKRVVMIREFIDEDAEKLIVLDSRKNDDPICECETNEHCICEKAVESLIKLCEEYLK